MFHALKSWAYLLILTKCNPLFEMTVSLVEGGISVKSDISIGNQVSEKVMLDLEYPGVIVPVGSYNPNHSESFRYCSEKEMCFDRMSPKFKCDSTVPASMWSPEHSAVTWHTVPIFGNISSFQMIDEISICNAQFHSIPMEGSLSPGLNYTIIGLGPSRISCRNETWLSKMGVGYVELNQGVLSGYHDPPVGGSSWTGQYEFLPPNASAVTGRYAFSLFHPTMCGVDLLGNVSSHWTTVLSASEQCLVLPEFLYKRYLVWSEGSDGYLDFSVGETQEDTVRIDLSTVCVSSSKTGFGNETNFAESGYYPIIFGREVIEYLSVNTSSVGLETVDPFRIRFSSSVSPPPSFCTVVQPQCVGNSRYYEPLNQCVPPACDKYIFQYLNADSMSCEWSPNLTGWVVVTGLVALVLGEWLAVAIKRRSVKVAERACERGLRVGG